jgi:2-dehydro-3-deoxygalactonokinase
MIGVDWGTTNLRAFRFSGDGAVIDTRTSPRGIASLKRDEIEGVLRDLAGDWLGEDRDVVLAGMVGSRSGWVETGYVPCPVDPSVLSRSLVSVESNLADCRIVPGVRSDDDVMRGEETQLLGAGVRDGCVVLPGTHSKWAMMEAGRIASIRTVMTGELYALLLNHSLIGQLAGDGSDPEAFARGVKRSRAEPSLATTLFSARSAVLLGQLAQKGVRDYLSGLLIGAEVATMARGADALTIIGEGALTQRYCTALSLCGVQQVEVIDGAQAVSRGLWMIGSADL